ncbi:MAG TPA: ribbon-helix-helix domain-containing protein [Methanomassiliicoccales archaeon]|nr:ribbon-helix-helix domain-containing protein [Methanomassiliicoccales archaeon]
MEGERISLRLENEDLELIDGFIEGHPEISNRSQLARIALRAFIDRDGGTRIEISGKGQLTINVPPAIRNIMEGMVEDGYYNTVEDIIGECLRKEFVSRENLDNVKDDLFHKGRQALANL